MVLPVAAVLWAAWHGLHSIPASIGYEVEADFAEVPPDDGALEAWLRSHPGVWSASVSRHPVGGRTRLWVLVGMTRDGFGRPPFPDLGGACADFGYRGQAGPFHDKE